MNTEHQCIRCKQQRNLIAREIALNSSFIVETLAGTGNEITLTQSSEALNQGLNNLVKYQSLCSMCWGEIIEAYKASQINAKPDKSADLMEGLHYYIAGGLFVFTAAYHFQRGSCCGNKCKHCPYGKWAVRE